MKRKHIFGLIAVGTIVGLAAWGLIVSNVEQAKYTVQESHGAIEIRDYAPMIVAQVEVSGERKEAINQGFRLIADYIFGNNSVAQKVAMTAPVIQQPSETIAMTSPVMQQGEGKNWRVQFVMPAQYTLATLPKPNNPAVMLREVDGSRFAVIRFSGMAGSETIRRNTELLMAFVEKNNHKPLALPVYGFFNPPWTLPFFRRNEVMVEITG